jgi:hypothetical protein
MSAITLEAKGLPELQAAMLEYRVRIRDDQAIAMSRAARQLARGLHEELRRVPPRPADGSILAAAKARGYRLNPLSRSYMSGYSSALRTFGANKSGYFRIEENNGIPRAVPIVLGRKRKIVLAGRKNVFQRGALLTSRAEVADASTIPSDAVRLNVTALAAVRALQIRGRAGRGGYLAGQFLTWKRVKSTKSQPNVRQVMKNNITGGEVIFETDNDGALEKIIVVGRLPGTAKIAAKYGIIDRAASVAAVAMRRDMQDYLAKRANAVFAGRRAA